MITGNKGEWSEVYTFLKILGDKKIYLGDENLNIVKNIFFPIVEVLRIDCNSNCMYHLQNDSVLVIISGSEKLKLPIEEFKEKSLLLLKKLKENTKGAFSVPEIEQFMQKIHCTSLKAKSQSKRDITIKIHDTKTDEHSLFGFSIKSQLGNPSTLLNASRATNFIYQINNLSLDKNEIKNINSISSKNKIRDRMEFILKKGGELSFIKNENRTFANNLTLIDSLLPNMMAEILHDFFSGKASNLYDLINIVTDRNPLNFDIIQNHDFYAYKMKRFLTDIALGMMPSTLWNGVYDSTGGYLVVKNTGDILCYHLYYKDEFEKYLLKNTRLDTPSSSRHKFGYIYEENNKLYFKLNLQIRFIK
jgi:type II restriction enzyme